MGASRPSVPSFLLLLLLLFFALFLLTRPLPPPCPSLFSFFFCRGVLQLARRSGATEASGTFQKVLLRGRPLARVYGAAVCAFIGSGRFAPSPSPASAGASARLVAATSLGAPGTSYATAWLKCRTRAIDADLRGPPPAARALPAGRAAGQKRRSAVTALARAAERHASPYGPSAPCAGCAAARRPSKTIGG